MGYTTTFEGQIKVDPPLNASEKSYLEDFANTRRMSRAKGPYFVGGTGIMGQGSDPDIRNHNQPPEGQPELWCKWEPTEDGKFLEWNGAEKFYSSAEWMQYLIDNFLAPNALLLPLCRNTAEFWVRGWPVDERFSDFTFDHLCNGEIEAQGEDPDDRWILAVRNNEVRALAGEFVYEEWED